MPGSPRARCRAILHPLIAAPLGLLLGCGGTGELPSAAHQEAPPRPRLLAPELLAESLADARLDGQLWRVTAASYGSEADEEGVFRLPAVAGDTLPLVHSAPRLVESFSGPSFPEPGGVAPPPMHSVIVKTEVDDLATPSELSLDEADEVLPVPVMEGLPPVIEPLPSPSPQPSSYAPPPPSTIEPTLRPTPLPWADVARASSPAMRAVSERAAGQVRSGFVLANRGAYYSARSEFVAALRSISQALDSAAGGRFHSEALAAGLRALEESDDFVPRGAQVEADLDLAALLPAHQTPLLKNRPLESITTLAARRLYYTYAQEQLALAAGRERAGSMALYGLAKLQMALEAQNPMRHTSAAPKAMALHQAALLADGSNYLAANELGVLLARFGQYQQARDVLLHSAHQVPLPAAWHNLAVVHQHLGESHLAASAEQQARQLTQSSVADPLLGQQSAVVWTTPAAFAQSGEARQTTALRGTAPESASSRSGYWQR